MKLIALYFPQFHPIRENDEWWGTGFTDWHNVKAARPQYKGHDQPRVPMGRNYYNQAELATIRWQAALARQYGIHGFCHYHYWFDGKQLLHTPTELLLSNRDIDMPFCLSWANETWSRRWDGLDHHILIQQTHPPHEESWRRHFDYLIRAWKDPRAIKVGGKPVFIIYRPQRIPHIDDMLSYWRKLAVAEGLPGLYFIFQKQYELPSRNCLKSFDALFQFQPFEAIYSPGFDARSIRHSPLFRFARRMPEAVQNRLRAVRARFYKQLTFHDYDAVWKQVVAVRPDPELTTFPGAFVDWDNTARYKNRATIFRGATPERFRHWFAKLAESMPARNLPEDFVFINAWNEWSESAYLEPDERHGYGYLDAVAYVLGLEASRRAPPRRRYADQACS